MPFFFYRKDKDAWISFNPNEFHNSEFNKNMIYIDGTEYEYQETSKMIGKITKQNKVRVWFYSKHSSVNYTKNKYIFDFDSKLEAKTIIKFNIQNNSAINIELFNKVKYTYLHIFVLYPITNIARNNVTVHIFIYRQMKMQK